MRRQALLVPLVILVCSSPLLADCSVLSCVTMLDANLTAGVIPLGAARDFFLEKRHICRGFSENCYETSETTAGTMRSGTSTLTGAPGDR